MSGAIRTVCQTPQAMRSRRGGGRLGRLPTITSQLNIARCSADITSHLLRCLPAHAPPSVANPMRRLILSAPPTVAPSVCLAAAELVSAALDIAAFNAACAIQLIHAAAAAHSAVINVKANSADLMSGCALLSMGYEMIVRTPADDAEAAGKFVMALIEVTEAEADGSEEGECRLAACAAACGVILGGGTKEEAERARRVGLLAGRREWALAEEELDGFQAPAGSSAAFRRLLHGQKRKAAAAGGI